MPKLGQHYKQTQTESYIQQMFKDVCDGLTRYEMQLKWKNGEYKVAPSPQGKDSTAKMTVNYFNKLYNQTMEVMHLEIAERKDEEREKCYNRLLSLYNNCLHNQDRYNAKGTLDSMIKLMGISAPIESKVQMDANVNETVTINFGFNDDDNDDNEDAEDIKNES